MSAPSAGAPPTAAEPPVGSPEWVERHGLSCVLANRLAQLELGRTDPRIFSIEADLGDFYGFDFRDRFPERWLDFGIAEASMIGAAAGLALAGKVPLVNTFASFALMRAAEQVRLDICYHAANVKIFGTFAGLQSSFSGPSHHSIEDLAIARSMPNLVVLAPADAVAVYQATLLAARHRGPVYVRLAMDASRQIYGPDCRLEIGGSTRLREGGDLTLAAAGLTVVPNALDAAERLAADGIEARVLDLYSIKPIDRRAVIEAARETGLVVTVEEHNVLGGLGGAVAEVLAEEYPVPVEILGVPDRYCEELGSHAEQLERYGLDPEGIARSARAALERKDRRGGASAAPPRGEMR